MSTPQMDARPAGKTHRLPLAISRVSPVLWIALLFVLSGIPFLAKTGIHFDTGYELGSFYSCCSPAFKPVLFDYIFPIMILPYLGAFKTWLYQPILNYLEVTPVILRLPTLLAGAVSVWLSFRILEKISGRRAAIAGSLLLATDATFLIATTYDFGPIAFLHLFLLAGISLLLRFYQRRSLVHLALAFFLFGLAMWHKALFVWMLNGAAAATVLVAFRKIRPLLSLRNLAVAVFSFCLGALPLISYNIASRGATLHTEKVMSGAAPLSQKLAILKATMDSSVLFGWLTEKAQPETAVSPASLRARVSVAAAHLTGIRSSLMVYLVVASCCLIPWLWFTPARKPTMFVLIYLAVTWVQMIIPANTGATLHHAILLWPFPHFLVAIAAAEASNRIRRHSKVVFASFLALVGTWNLLLINRCYADLITRGTTVIWTDAIYPLYRYLDSLEGYRIFATDWGYSATLCLLSDGEMPVHDISYTLLQPSAPEVEWIGSLMGNSRSLFVDHTEAGQQFPGVRARLESIAAQRRVVREIIYTGSDRNARPRFEVFRYRAQ